MQVLIYILFGLPQRCLYSKYWNSLRPPRWPGCPSRTTNSAAAGRAFCREAHWSLSLGFYCGDGQEGLLCLATPLKFQPPRKQADVTINHIVQAAWTQTTLSVRGRCPPAWGALHSPGFPDTSQGQQPWACSVSASPHRIALRSCKRPAATPQALMMGKAM